MSATETDVWEEAVLNECMVIEGCYKPSDPAGTVKCLIDWHVQNALDGKGTGENFFG